MLDEHVLERSHRRPEQDRRAARRGRRDGGEGVARALVLAGVVALASAVGTPLRARGSESRAGRASSRGEPAKAGASPRSPQRKRPIESFDSISVGHPDVGYLLNGVRVPKSPGWELTAPGHAWGTRETIDQLSHCVARVRKQFANTPPVMLGSLSKRGGGTLPPHRSHRTGRDADVYFYRKPGAQWHEAATQDDIDLPRTWALLRCFVAETEVDFVLVDRGVQAWFERYALSIGEDAQWVRSAFHDTPGSRDAVFRHAPGHVAHAHVRFVSAESRRRGHELYDRLVREGRVRPARTAVEHRVRRGDTLGEIARKYAVRVRDIQALNRLRGTLIRVGQRLTISVAAPLRGVRDPIRRPRRRRPPEPSPE